MIQFISQKMAYTSKHIKVLQQHTHICTYMGQKSMYTYIHASIHACAQMGQIPKNLEQCYEKENAMKTSFIIIDILILLQFFDPIHTPNSYTRWSAMSLDNRGPQYTRGLTLFLTDTLEIVFLGRKPLSRIQTGSEKLLVSRLTPSIMQCYVQEQMRQQCFIQLTQL